MMIITMDNLNKVLAEIEDEIQKLANGDMLKKGALEQTQWTLRKVSTSAIRKAIIQEDPK